MWMTLQFYTMHFLTKCQRTCKFATMKPSKVIFICMIFFVFQTAETLFAIRDGICRDPDDVENLNMQKMVGSWYIIKESESSALCSILKFEEMLINGQSINHFWITKCTSEYDGKFECFLFAKLKFSNEISAQVNRELLFGDSFDNDFKFRVVITDYNTYAGIYFCKNCPGYSRAESTMISSREPDLDQHYINKISSKFEEFIIRSDNLYENDQSQCPSAQIILTVSFEIYLISLLMIMIFK